jgi:hypothetical protein
MAINNKAGHDATPRETAQDLGGEIVAVRQDLDALLAEADRRRHAALNVTLQLRRHAPAAALTTIAILGAAASLVWFETRRRRRRQRLSARANRLRQAVSRMVDQPERVAAEPTLVGRIVLATVIPAVAAVTNKMVGRAIKYLLDSGRTDLRSDGARGSRRSWSRVG